MSYQLTNNNTVIRLRDDAIIPFDEGNRDYQEYLGWLDEGNVPDQPVVAQNILPDYLGFWDGLLISSVYQSIRAQAITTPTVLVACTEFIASFTDAKNGRANVPAIQACIDYLMQAGTFSQSEVDELNVLLVDNRLDQLFVITQ